MSLNGFNNLRAAFDYVEENYASEITLKKAAELTNYNIKSFCRVFKKTTNTTFHNYLNSYRIECAAELLKQKTLSVTDIAVMVGIPVTKSFARIFRQKTGLCPTEYRQRLKISIKDK
jgi:transcriptional regulator GlxA family with amidase domain